MNSKTNNNNNDNNNNNNNYYYYYYYYYYCYCYYYATYPYLTLFVLFKLLLTGPNTSLLLLCILFALRLIVSVDGGLTVRTSKPG